MICGGKGPTESTGAIPYCRRKNCGDGPPQPEVQGGSDRLELSVPFCGLIPTSLQIRHEAIRQRMGCIVSEGIECLVLTFPSFVHLGTREGKRSKPHKLRATHLPQICGLQRSLISEYHQRSHPLLILVYANERQGPDTYVECEDAEQGHICKGYNRSIVERARCLWWCFACSPEFPCRASASRTASFIRSPPLPRPS